MNKTRFIENYITSLNERTRKETSGIKVGFDWIISNLAIAKGYISVRRPFYIKPDDETATTKTEAEFGVDFSFYNPEDKELIIFTLKDEELNNKNWCKNKFDSDIRMAAAPKLDNIDWDINSVKVILAYNKDDDNTGIQLFENLTKTLGNTIYDNISLNFDRWNIGRITAEVEQYLLNPDLLPQHLTGLFEYICSQFKDFDYGTNEWEQQLIPNWKRFLKQILEEPLDIKKLRLIAVVLIILQNYKQDKPNAKIGWIDLVEWAVIELWNNYKNLKDNIEKTAVIDLWSSLYIGELEQYFNEQYETLTSENSFNQVDRRYHNLASIINANSSLWHLGRLGILNISPQEFLLQSDENIGVFKEWVTKWSNLTIKFLRNNSSSAFRPLIDLHHIELFLTWLTLWQSGNEDEIFMWLSELENRLMIRRASPESTIPFIEAGNNLELVAEYMASNEKPVEYVDSSSYLLLMILELCFTITNEEQRNELLNRYMNRVINGKFYDNDENKDSTKINLLGWVPPENWSEKILNGRVYEGISVSTHNFNNIEAKEKNLMQNIEEFVKNTREKDCFTVNLAIPSSIYILACIKNKSPLPSEFWRAQIWGPPEE